MKTVDWFVRGWIGDCFHETYRPQAAQKLATNARRHTNKNTNET